MGQGIHVVSVTAPSSLQDHRFPLQTEPVLTSCIIHVPSCLLCSAITKDLASAFVGFYIQDIVVVAASTASNSQEADNRS